MQICTLHRMEILLRILRIVDCLKWYGALLHGELFLLDLLCNMLSLLLFSLCLIIVIAIVAVINIIFGQILELLTLDIYLFHSQRP